MCCPAGTATPASLSAGSRPDTANPHALITQQTANETGPVSPAWMARTFGGLGSTLEQLRVDRQLDEALTRGPNPLHLAAVFDIDAKTAVRYANNARQLLPTGSETQPVAGSPQPEAHTLTKGPFGAQVPSADPSVRVNSGTFRPDTPKRVASRQLG